MRRDGEQTQAGAQVAGAGADLERPVRCIDAQRLQDAPLYLGREHRLTEADGNRRIGERELAIARGHERLAWYRAGAHRARAGRALPRCGSVDPPFAVERRLYP